MNAPPGATAGLKVLLLVGFGSAVALAVLLGRAVLREREDTNRAVTRKEVVEGDARSLRQQLAQARDEQARGLAEADRQRKASDAEIARLARELADAVKERDTLGEKYRAAASERERAMDDLLAARRDADSLRTDLARATARTRDAEAAAAESGRKAAEAGKAAEAASRRLAALLRPLLQDLRSNDGGLRVRAHEALCVYAGRDLPFRPNGTPEEREADARALEDALLPK